MNHCANCGAPLPPGAQFCPRCGANLAVSPPPPSAPPSTAPPPAPRAHRGVVWWLVPLVVVAVAGIAFLLLLGLPFGREGDKPPQIERVEEADPPSSSEPSAQSTGTIVDVPDEPAPTRAAPRPSTEITDAQAVSTLRGYIASRNYYQGTGPGCLALATREYRNAGYTIDVSDSCASRPLGRWRVDAKTREVFRQREDGRYLRP